MPEETTIKLVIKWQNDSHFDVTSKENDEDVVTVLHMDENGDIPVLWPSATDMMERHIKNLMARIGADMAKAEGA